MGLAQRELCPEGWFALTVRHQHEWQVEQWLSAQGWPTFVPSYRVERQWSDRRKQIQLPLFSGYVFCQFPLTQKSAVLRTPGVVNIVSFAGAPAMLDPREFGQLQQALASGFPFAPWSHLRSGDRVRIERGPLKGVEGHLLEDAGVARLVIGIEMLHRLVAVDLPPNFVSYPLPARLPGQAQFQAHAQVQGGRLANF